MTVSRFIAYVVTAAGFTMLLLSRLFVLNTDRHSLRRLRKRADCSVALGAAIVIAIIFMQTGTEPIEIKLDGALLVVVVYFTVCRYAGLNRDVRGAK